MKNKFLILSFVLYTIATLLGIISTTGIQEARDSLMAFHLGSTALMLGLMGLATMMISRFWKE